MAVKTIAEVKEFLRVSRELQKNHHPNSKEYAGYSERIYVLKWFIQNTKQAEPIYEQEAD